MSLPHTVGSTVSTISSPSDSIPISSTTYVTNRTNEDKSVPSQETQDSSDCQPAGLHRVPSSPSVGRAVSFVRLHRVVDEDDDIEEFSDSPQSRHRRLDHRPSGSAIGGGAGTSDTIAYVSSPVSSRPPSFVSAKEKVGSFSASVASQASDASSEYEQPQFHPDQAETPTLQPAISPSTIAHPIHHIISHHRSVSPSTVPAQANIASASTAEPSNIEDFTMPAAASAPSGAAGSPRLRALHFHSSLPESIHNPLVQVERFRSGSTSGGGGERVVRGLDEDEIKLEENSNEPSPSPSPHPSSSVTTDPDVLITNRPLPPAISQAAHGAFSQREWKWTSIDYFEEHHDVLKEFFHAIETHSEAYVARLNAPPVIEPPPLPPMRHARTESSGTLRALPPLTTTRSASSSASAHLSIATSPSPTHASGGSIGSLPALSPNPPGSSPPRTPGSSPSSSSSSILLGALGAVTSLFASPSPSSEPPQTEPPAPPIYAPDFVPHRLESLVLIAKKSLLHKTNIIQGPTYSAKNPTEKLLAALLSKSGTASISATEPLSARGSTQGRYRLPGYAAAISSAASAAFPFLSGGSGGGGNTSGATVPGSYNFLPHLTKLDIRMGIDGLTLAEALKRNATLTELCLSSNVISEKGCTLICKNLHQHPALKKLDLGQNILYPQAAQALRDLFLYNRQISSLDVSVNKLGEEGVATLMEAFGASKNNRTIFHSVVEKQSVISSQPSTGSSATPAPSNPSTSPPPPSARAASPSPSTSPVRSTHSATPAASSPRASGGSKDASAHAGSSASASPPAPSSSPVHGPSASSSPTGSESAAASPSPSSSAMFVPAFSINQSLTFLDLSNNRTGHGLSALCSALIASNSPLRDLSLGMNDIGDIGASYLALALRHPSCRLTFLSLPDNSIGPLGCKSLMQSLECNTHLTRLDLSWNHTNSSGLGEGPKAIGRMLASPLSVLKELILTSNGLNETGVRTIVAGWRERNRNAKQQQPQQVGGSLAEGELSPSPLETLDLSVNSIGSEGLIALSPMLAVGSGLRTLRLNRCALGDEGLLSALVPAVEHTPLRRLYLQGNHALKVDALTSLVSVYGRAERLVELDIEDHPTIAREETLSKAYRKARRTAMAKVLCQATDEILLMPIAAIVAEYCLDLRARSFTAAPSSNHPDQQDQQV